MNRVLLVDDCTDQLEMMKLFLDTLGYQADCFASPLAALAFLKDNYISLIITDLCMPGMSGLDFAKHAKNIYPDSKILLLTCYPDFKSTLDAIDIGIDNYLVKPLQRFQLQKLLDLYFKQAGPHAQKN